MADLTLSIPAAPVPQSLSQQGLEAFAAVLPLARGLSDVQPAGAPGALMAELRSRA